MDTDLEDRQREEELSRLRALGASSPSTISTASSGSPLVRGSSAAKRPAPTSIAAAQLQCQQQSRLEFTNHLSGPSSAKRAHRNQAPLFKGVGVSGDKQVADQWRSAAEQAKGGSKAQQAGNKKAKQLQQARDSSPQEAKSFGYNLSKSIAYKVFR